MARYDPQEYVAYQEEDDDLPEPSRKVMVGIFGFVVLLVIIGGLYMFRDELFPPAPPPHYVNEKVTKGSPLIVYDLPFVPQLISTTDTTVWLANGRQLAAFDVQSRKVVRKVTLRQPATSILATPDGIWASGTASVSRYSLAGQLMATVSVGNQPGQMTTTNQRLWVINEADDTLSVINTDNNKVTKTIPVAPDPFAMTPIDDRTLWVAHGDPLSDDSSDPLLEQIVNDQPKVQEPVDADLRGIAAVPKQLWTIYGASQTADRFSPTTGKPLGGGLIRLIGHPRFITAFDGNMYIAMESNGIQVINPFTLQRLRKTTTDQKAITGMGVNAGGVWILRNGAKELVRWQQCTSTVPCLVPTLIQ